MMARGFVFTVFLKHDNQHIGIVPYTQKNFTSKRIYDWEGVRHHKVGNKRRLRANTADMHKMAKYIDRGARGYRRSSDALHQLEVWINQTQGELAA